VVSAHVVPGALPLLTVFTDRRQRLDRLRQPVEQIGVREGPQVLGHGCHASIVRCSSVEGADAPGTVTTVAEPGWQSYDSVATAYDRLWRPSFERIARDLVDAAGVVGLPDDAAILDVGTGSGGVAIEALRAGPHGLVVGLDPSAPMLRLARTNVPLAPVAAACPSLPFPAGAFHAVLANVVLSHFERYDTALADMVRVLRPGGRLGVTAWGSLDEEPVDDGQQRELSGIWKSVAGRFVDVDAAAEGIEAAIPWEGWFGDPAHLRGALEASGLRDVALHARMYRAEVTQSDMLAGYETSFWGRYLRHALGDAEWQRFLRNVAETARAALPDSITRVDQLLIAVGTKRFDTPP
jgi:ubiquinone/menaquinone biosynthesis C-methylase UbiE